MEKQSNLSIKKFVQFQLKIQNHKNMENIYVKNKDNGRRY